MMRPIEPSPDDAFHDQMIGAGRCSPADPEVDLPVRRNIQINRRKKLLLLIVERKYIRDGPVSSVVFQPSRDVFVEVVAEFFTWRKLYAVVADYPIFAYPEVRDVRDGNTVFTAVAADTIEIFGLEADGVTRPVWGYIVSGQYFEVVAIKPHLGRLL